MFLPKDVLGGDRIGTRVKGETEALLGVGGLGVAQTDAGARTTKRRLGRGLSAEQSSKEHSH